MAGSFAEIAVPIPLHQPLTYSVPERWRSLAQIVFEERFGQSFSPED